MLRRSDLEFLERLDTERLGAVCTAAATWLEEAGEAQRSQVLEALHLKVGATREEAKITGVIPSEAPELITTGRTSA